MKESGISIMIQERIVLQGKSIAQVAQESGMSRNTVRKYLREGERKHAAIGVLKGSKLDPFKDQVEALLAQGVYNASVIFERISDNGFKGGITIVRDFVSPLRPPSVKIINAVRRYETKPGKQAQMDWGYMDYVGLDKRIHKVACFVMVLGNSRSRYVEFVRRCDEASLLRCITNAFEYYGGIPDTVLTDHMKTVVVSSDNGKPVWHKTFERFATDMCFVPKLCRVRRPQTKGKVERLVHYVRDNFLPGRTFTDMGDLQQQARQWCDRANGKIHGTTGERPVEMLAQEHLKPLPNEAILRQYRWESRKVSREGFVSYDGALYGVSWIHSGKTVLVSRTGTQVQISDALGEVLEIHEVCHRSRKHVPAQRQYVGLADQNGIPHVRSCARQITSEDVEIRPLAVYEQITEVG